MAPEKRNEFLDAEDSEDEQVNNYDSEEEISKGGRSAKRRRVDESADEDEGSDFEDAPGDLDGANANSEDKAADDDEKEASLKKTPSELLDISRPLTKKNLVVSEAAIRKSGVVYLSRIPPFMKPIKLRTLLEPYGTINRIFLAPEDPAAHARRVKAGGNKRKTYTEGWVEFTRKKDAKRVCELLNARIIGGKKGSYYHDDIWNLLYLKGFKWNNLTEQIAAENAERESRMRAEISKATKENKEFVRNVEQAKKLDGMQKSKKRKTAPAEGAAVTEKPQTLGEKARVFKQVSRVQKDQDKAQQPEHVTRVLSKIF
jgi:ESF2/ABP1 family protein